ncbi:MAG: ABC transporter permease, partial [Corynebacterium matruchotii]
MQTTKSNWWQGLTVQPIVILAILIALIIWLSTAQFTSTELATLTLSNLLNLTVQHLELTAVSIVVVLIFAIPLGILLTRKPFRWLTTPVMSLANLGQAAPAIGLVVLIAFWLGFGFTTAAVALILYAFLPVLKNTMVGLDAVDPKLVEAGRG